MTVRSVWKEARPFVAILLAYAIAAQVLVAGVAGGQGAAASDTPPIPICYRGGASTDEPGQPAPSKLPCAVCAAALCAPALAGGKAVELAPTVQAAALAPFPAGLPAGTAETRTRFSRGPPATA